ncbi:MAG: glycosyltransferase, partial [Actinomycetota bacterium]
MQSQSRSPLLSAIVLNFNGGAMVGDCLQSVADQDISSVETIVVDNASTDDSAGAISTRFPGFRMLRLESNKGYTGGMNAGIRAARGVFVALLNFDVTLDRDYLRICAEALAADPGLGGVTGKLLRPGTSDPQVIDTAGHVVYRNRRAVDRGEAEPDRGQYDEATEVFGVCGAAP